MVAGAVPAWLAARADPVASVRPPVLAVRRARQPSGITGLAVVNVLRTPGRTLIGALSLAIGVMALTLLVAVTLAFRGAVVGTLLGTVVTVQVRGVDYVAVAATVTLGVLAVADAVVISITERAPELATIRAFGWPERTLHRLVITEGALTGVAGSVAGAALGLVARGRVRRAAVTAAVRRRGRGGRGRRPGDLRGRAAARPATAPAARRPATRRGITMTQPDPVTHGAIELRGVSKRYGTGDAQPVTAADDVTVQIEPGAFLALTGASGSGKSTLLHLIGALERPDSGTITSGGTEVTALRGAALAAYRRTVGFVFQRYNLLPALTAADNVIAPVLPVPDQLGQVRPRPPAPRGRRPGRAGTLPAVPDVRRRAAAGGHRPGADQHPAPAAGRRAHRQPGLPHRYRDP